MNSKNLKRGKIRGVALDREILLKLQGKHVRLVKNDSFVIDGKIKNVYDDCIEFFSDGRIIILAFDRISEIAPYRNNRRDFDY